MAGHDQTRRDVSPLRGRPRGMRRQPAVAPRSGPGRSTACSRATARQSGRGAKRAGTPARLTGSVQRDTNRSSPLSRCGGKMPKVGVTRRSTSAKVRSRVSFHARCTRQAASTVRSSKDPPSSSRPRTPSLMPSGSSATDAASECQASTTSKRPACRVASSQPGTSSSRQSQPTSPKARSSAAVMVGSASMGNRPTTRSATSLPATLNPGSSSSIPVTSPATVRAMGPMVSKLGASGQTPSNGIRPQVVFRPAMPQQAAGIRMDPPVSLP